MLKLLQLQIYAVNSIRTVVCTVSVSHGVVHSSPTRWGDEADPQPNVDPQFRKSSRRPMALLQPVYYHEIQVLRFCGTKLSGFTLHNASLAVESRLEQKFNGMSFD
jgi:hypothetical protein